MVLDKTLERITELERRVSRMVMQLNFIANKFMTPEEIREDCENKGLTYEEYLEMAYENMQEAAATAVSQEVNA